MFVSRLEFFVVFVFLVSDFFFWILMMFSSATRIAKKPKHFRKTKKIGETENPEDSKECLGPGLSLEVLVFLFFDVFLSNSSFLVFGSGRFHHHRLLGLQKSPEITEKHWNVWVQDFLQRFLLVLVAAPTTHKTNLFSFKPYPYHP